METVCTRRGAHPCARPPSLVSRPPSSAHRRAACPHAAASPVLSARELCHGDAPVGTALTGFAGELSEGFRSAIGILKDHRIRIAAQSMKLPGTDCRRNRSDSSSAKRIRAVPTGAQVGRPGGRLLPICAERRTSNARPYGWCGGVPYTQKSVPQDRSCSTRNSLYTVAGSRSSSGGIRAGSNMTSEWLSRISFFSRTSPVSASVVTR